MTFTSILVFIVMAIVVVFVVCKANGISLFSKIKNLFKMSAKEKNDTASVLPSEKPKKSFFASKSSKSVESKTKVSAGVSDEKLRDKVKKSLDAKGNITDTNKVSKVTKDDFIKNNIPLPSGLTSSGKQSNSEAVYGVGAATSASGKGSIFEGSSAPKFSPAGFGDSSKPLPSFTSGSAFKPKQSAPFSGFDSNTADPFEDLNFDELLAELEKDEDFSMQDEKPAEDKYEALATSILQPAKSAAGAQEPSEQIGKKEFTQKDSVSYYGDLKNQFNISQTQYNGPLINKNLDERFNEVFGDTSEVFGSNAVKEIVVGDILSSPRAKTNMDNRARRLERLKWL